MSQGTVQKLHPEMVSELLIRVRQFVSSCRHDLLFVSCWVVSGLVFAVGADGCSRLVSLGFSSHASLGFGVRIRLSFSIGFLVSCRCVFFWCW